MPEEELSLWISFAAIVAVFLLIAVGLGIYSRSWEIKQIKILKERYYVDSVELLGYEYSQTKGKGKLYLIGGVYQVVLWTKVREVEKLSG